MSGRILITSGPTREHLDPVRYLSNASSGQMGRCLAAAAIDSGYEVIVVSGPVDVDYPAQATVISVETTQQMLDAVVEQWDQCVGIIAAAAPCDFRPASPSDSKIKRNGDEPLSISLVANPDILKTVGDSKQSHQWSIGFALETENGIENAVAKLKRKNCDLIVLNSPTAINAASSEVKIIGSDGAVVLEANGSKTEIAASILKLMCS